MNKFFKEPLLHFLLIGAAFFLLYDLVGSNESSAQTIVIDESDLDEIVSKFTSQWKRNPTEEELIAILDKRIEEEVFYQEALKLNLDHNDEIIKRRLSQKMKFLSDDISQINQPSESELKLYFENNSSNYVQEANYTLYQVFFSPDSRDNWREDAKKALAKASTISIQEVTDLGDPFSLPGYYENTSTFHLTRQMGQDFVTGLDSLPAGEWSGVIESGYGAHIVYIKEKIEEHVSDFIEVKEKVLADYNYHKQQETSQLLIREFKKNYSINLDVQSENYPEDLLEKLRMEISE